MQPIQINIKYDNLRATVSWCEKHVGERKYYLHNQVGGHKWRIFRSRSSNYVLELVDEKAAVFFAISQL